jgi:hypothetical protein
MSHVSCGYFLYKGSDAYGETVQIRGPGMPMYTNFIHLLQPFNEWASKHYNVESEKERLTGLLNAAFNAGREDMRAEFRSILGVK